MGAETRIEWCDATLNLWWGCTKVSDGCKHCYAEQLSDQRYKKGAWGPGGVRTEVKSWRSTLAKISKQAKAEGRRLRVFCQSMSDTFEGPETMGGGRSKNYGLVESLRLELFAAIEANPELVFLLLTKRPENVLEQIQEAYDSIHPACYAPESVKYPHLVGTFLADWLRGKHPENVWIGTSVENQATADERIPHLLAIPAAVRFLSCEPLLGPVDLDIPMCDVCNSAEHLQPEHGCLRCVQCDGREAHYGWLEERIHWVICGGESGPNARPMDLAWAISLQEQCEAAGTAFFMKQLGRHPMGNSLDSFEPWPITDAKGHNIEEFPEVLRVRQFPTEVGEERDERTGTSRTAKTGR